MPLVLIDGRALRIAGALLSTTSLTPGGTVPVSPPPSAPPATPAGELGIAMAIRDTYAGANAASNYPHPVANVWAVNAAAAVTFALTDPSGKYALDGGTISNTGTVAAGVYPVTVTATEASSGRTATATLNLQAVARKGVYISTTRISDASPADTKIGMNAVDVTTFEDLTWTLSDASGQFGIDPHYWYLYFSQGKAPPVGTYPVTVKVTNKAGVVLDTSFTLEVYAEPAQTAPQFTAYPVSSVDVAGTAIGRLSAYNATGRYDFAVTDTAGGVLQSFVGSSGKVYLAKGNPAVGGLAFTASVSNGITSASASFTLPVAQGYLLPASAMRLAAPTTLDNARYNQVLGTPTVSGITGKPRWTIKHESDNSTDYFGRSMSAFVIDPDTGYITCPPIMSARHPDHPARASDGHVVEVTCSDGVNRCTQTFTVPVAWKTGPTYYVGRGMAAAHPGFGYEHLTDLYPTLCPANGVLAPDVAGYTLKIAADSDPDYYACDNGNGQNGFPQLNYNRGLAGPGIIEALDPTGPLPRLGGLLGSSYGGVDGAGKGFLTADNGDHIWRNLEVSFVQGFAEANTGGPNEPYKDNTHGVSGLRKNAQTYGDFYVIGCYVHDCNNCIETGFRPGHDYILNNELCNAGTQYVNGGATHNFYGGATTYTLFSGNLSYNTINGHSLKCRAFTGLFENNRLYDGERGSSSAVVDIPQGGVHTFRNNVIHKGPNAQNSGAMQLSADEDTSRSIHFTLENNTYIVQSLIAHYGYPSAIKYTMTRNVNTGEQSTVTSEGESFYLAGVAVQLEEPAIHDNHPVSGSTHAVITNPITLTYPPALDFSFPGTGQKSESRPGYYTMVQEQGVNNNWFNFYGAQVDPGAEQLRVTPSAPVGTVVARLTAYGANVYKNTLNDPYAAALVNPFSPNATFSLTHDLDYDFRDQTDKTGKYTVVATSANTADLRVAKPLTTGTDFVKIRAVGANGKIADWRFFVSVAA